MRRLSAHELRAARKAQDWNTLWEQAIPLVKFTRSSFVRGGMDPKYSTDDALQAAYLAVGQAVRTWEPSKGEFSTWIMFRAQGAIVDYIRREQSGIIGGRDSSHPTSSMQEGITSDAATKGIVAQMEREEEETEVWRFVASLRSATDKDIVASRFGLGAYPARTMREIAKRVGLSLATVERRLASALREMRGLAEKSRYKTPQRESK